MIDQPVQRDASWNGKNGRVSTSSAPYKVYDIGNNNPVKLMNFIQAIENKLDKKIPKNFLQLQAGDVPATSIQEGIDKFVDWYVEFFQKRTY